MKNFGLALCAVSLLCLLPACFGPKKEATVVHEAAKVEKAPARERRSADRHAKEMVAMEIPSYDGDEDILMLAEEPSYDGDEEIALLVKGEAARN